MTRKRRRWDRVSERREVGKQSSSSHTSSDNHPPFRMDKTILQEVLEEVSTSGRVFDFRRQFVQARLRRNAMNGNAEEEEEEMTYVFVDRKEQSVFERMAGDLREMNEELDKKDESGIGGVEEDAEQLQREEEEEEASTVVSQTTEGSDSDGTTSRQLSTERQC
ncbi:unnamed protein product [Hydatigera taeniaeformis]|uniref:Uncharacterized protein n=1 Tax=Hydatigena taeniaeformis TaxID=6205 RepID=A0A0R3XCS8_HYDTA|nr:unnamed protein product [Hydatigera taeniaeformis]